MTIEAASNPYFWGDFQSVAQLAVALNSAFAGLVPLLGNDLARIDGKLRAAIKTEHPTPFIIEPTSLSRNSRLRLASGNLKLKSRDYVDTMDFIFRPVLFAGVIIGMLLLILSRFFYREPISCLWISAMLLSLVPFMCAVSYAAYTSMRLHFIGFQVRRGAR